MTGSPQGKVNPEFVNYTLEKLKQIADSMTETPEGIAFGSALLRLQEVDPQRAAALCVVFSDFVVANSRRVAVAFYRMGEAAGLAAAKQQQEKRRAKPQPPRQGPRLQ